MDREPIATYRLQLRPGFGFDEAAGLVGYLAELGVSHLYASPYLQAVSGSLHGYDIVDPSRVNQELGGAEAHARLCEALLAAGLGQMIDVVPNHMAIAGKQNPWWWDVLENGPASRYATYFDVDWAASEERWPNKVLLPVLADQYGRVLEDGQFQLTRDGGVFILHYRDSAFPIDPSSLGPLLGAPAQSSRSELLEFLADSHARLPRPTVTARQAVARRDREKVVLAALVARLCAESKEVAAAVDEEVARINGDADAMDQLIDQQNYRLALWRTASRDLGYRRFFDVKDLVGLKVEDIEVFYAAHALPIAWVKRGWVQGLRIDHPDGLRDPTQYFARLREACPDAWIVAEKILMPDERVTSDWPIAGTTGYDFLNLIGGLFIDPAGKEPLTRLYEELAGEQSMFEDLVRECKRLVLNRLLASELNQLSSLFVNICEQHRRHRDYTRFELIEALRETAACFPVYRSYVSASAKRVRPEDERYIHAAARKAAEERPDLDPALFQFLEDILALRVAGDLEGELAMRFQQLTGPAMAKGVEDTALYRYNRLIALNEIGGDPDRFGISPEQFHGECSAAAAQRPRALLATTTHDTKRSEDVRARLALLSEIPARWEQVVRGWYGMNARHRHGGLPDPNTEYLLYQTLVGGWPIDAARATAYMEKAAREAKSRTSWNKPDEAYERALSAFVQAIMRDEAFTADLERFVGELARPGRINGLAQTLIKLTAPGVPDIYQGTELWDLSLVDPDNRRPVDFDERRHLLAEASRLSPEEILSRMDEGLPKLWVVRQTLRVRRERPELFGLGGSYRPLHARGSKSDHVVAFVRGERVVTVAPRLVMGLGGDWADTVLDVPAASWRNVLTGEERSGGAAPLGELLRRFPVGLLVTRE